MTGLESLKKLREKNASGDKKEYFDAIEKELKDYKLLANTLTELVLTKPFKKLDQTQTNLYNIIINLLYDKKGLDIEEEEKNENVEIPQEVWEKVLNELELLSILKTKKVDIHYISLSRVDLKEYNDWCEDKDILTEEEYDKIKGWLNENN